MDLEDAHGIIFVIDSTDRLRLAVVKNELDELLTHKDVQGRKVPILLYANKMDDRTALSAVEVSRALELDGIKEKPWHICASCALTGEGLSEGVEWLSGQIKDLLDSRK